MLGGTRPPNLCAMQPPHGSIRMRPRGEGPPRIRSRGPRWWSLSRMPPPALRIRPPSPSPCRRGWPRWRPSPPPPPPALDVEALGASVATHVACQTLVEQAAATGVNAALAKGRAADHKSALARAEKVQGNTQRALDQALNLANKTGEELETVMGAVKTAEEERQKAEVEAAQLRVEVEAPWSRGNDLHQRLGVAEAQARSLTSTLSNFRATHIAAATLRPPVTPFVVGLNEYCTWNAPPWFTWCSIQVVRPQGTDTMGLHSVPPTLPTRGWVHKGCRLRVGRAGLGVND